MSWLMSYHCGETFAALAAEHSQAHVARLHEFHDRGLLLHAGPLHEPFNGDALGVFASKEAAEQFIAGDPFVINGVVETWTLRPWQDLFDHTAEGATAPPPGGVGGELTPAG